MSCKTLNTIGLAIFLLISTITYGVEKEEIANLNASFLSNESQLDSGFNLLGWLPFGPSYALTMKDSFCFVGSGGRIEVLLLNDSGNLTKAGEVKARGMITDLVIFENNLYAGLGNRGIEIFDINNPCSPISLSYTPNEGSDWVWNLEISYPYLFVANTYHLRILDVSNPSTPIELANMRPPQYPLSVAVRDTFLYVGQFQGIFEIYSISNPCSPQFLGSLRLQTRGYLYLTSVLLKYAYLFIGGFTASAYPNCRYLFVVDVSEPSNPILLAKDSLFYAIVWDAAIKDSLLYNLSWASLATYDIGNPTNPQLIGEFNLGGYRFAIKDSFLVMASGYEIRILNISDPTSPRHISQYNIEYPPQDFCIAEDFAYLGRGNELISVDISDPSNPTRVSSLMLSDDISDLVQKDTFVYVSACDSGVRVINISDPVNMREIGRWIGSNPLKNIWIKDTLAYVTDGDLLILNISNPTNPFLISSVTTQGNAARIFVQGNYAYVNDWEYGLIIVNISNPSSPFIEGFYERPNRTPSSIWAYESYLYITDDHLLIFDVSNPHLPVLLDSIWSPSLEEFVDVQTKENCLFVVRKTSMFTNYGTFADGINLYTLEQPSSPRLITNYYGPGRSEKIMIGEKIHLLDSKFGYSILELIPVGIEEKKPPLISDFFIKSRIGRAKQILLEYSLPKDGRAKIILYDRTGRKVSTLYNDHTDKGRHLLSLSNLTLPAGIYFVILEFENKRASAKMLFLR